MYLHVSRWCTLGTVGSDHLQSCCPCECGVCVWQREQRVPQDALHVPRAVHTAPRLDTQNQHLCSTPSLQGTPLPLSWALFTEAVWWHLHLLMIEFLWLNTGFSNPSLTRAHCVPHCLGHFPGVRGVSPLNKVTGRFYYSPQIRKLRHRVLGNPPQVGAGVTVWRQAIGLLRLHPLPSLCHLFF